MGFDFREKLAKMGEEDLKHLIVQARGELAGRQNKPLVVYTHECMNASKYHLGKYKHWAKWVKGIDTTKTNGYAFRGTFLNIHQEHKVPVGSIIVDVCDDDIDAYEMTEGGGKKTIAAGNRRKMSSFIAEVAEKTGLAL